MSRLTEVIKEYRGLGIEVQIDYEKFYLYSVITHSTAVEGSTVTEVENRLLFDEGISPNKPIEQQLMNLDLKRAYEEAIGCADQHIDYSVKLLCHLAGLVMRNTGKEYKTAAGNFSSADGELRKLNVTAGRGGKSYLSYQKVPQRLEDFCNWLNAQRKSIRTEDIDDVYELSFLAHYNLVSIHPWADGNGRMARLVMNMIQAEFGTVPSIVKKDCRDEYIKSLAESQDTGEAKYFLEFMICHHVQNLEKMISEYKDTVDNDTLNLGNDTINMKNDTLNLTEKEKRIYEMIKNDTTISIAQLVADSGFSRPTVTRAIRTLKEKKLIDRAGAKKNGFWLINP